MDGAALRIDASHPAKKRFDRGGARDHTRDRLSRRRRGSAPIGRRAEDPRLKKSRFKMSTMVETCRSRRAAGDSFPLPESVRARDRSRSRARERHHAARRAVPREVVGRRHVGRPERAPQVQGDQPERAGATRLRSPSVLRRPPARARVFSRRQIPVRRAAPIARRAPPERPLRASAAHTRRLPRPSPSARRSLRRLTSRSDGRPAVGSVSRRDRAGREEVAFLRRQQASYEERVNVIATEWNTLQADVTALAARVTGEVPTDPSPSTPLRRRRRTVSPKALRDRPGAAQRRAMATMRTARVPTRTTRTRTAPRAASAASTTTRGEWWRRRRARRRRQSDAGRPRRRRLRPRRARRPAQATPR